MKRKVPPLCRCLEPFPVLVQGDTTHNPPPTHRSTRQTTGRNRATDQTSRKATTKIGGSRDEYIIAKHNHGRTRPRQSAPGRHHSVRESRQPVAGGEARNYLLVYVSYVDLLSLFFINFFPQGFSLVRYSVMLRFSPSLEHRRVLGRQPDPVQAIAHLR